MGEPARKHHEEDILPEDAVLGPGTFKNVDTGRIVRKDHYGPIPPSGQSKRYIKLSDDPTYGLSEEEARGHREEAEQKTTSYEHPTKATVVKTGEIAGTGTYKCTRCGNEITFKDEGHVPPCSVCTNTEWRRE
ncbi:MAG TPA: hypothetical protein VHV83_05330 [Armatimonadota bacterium]|nr:hypothetical protein [Armatimonadota bacterium]